MKKTIFVISYCFPNNKNPQSGCFVLDQCVLLNKIGYNIVVLNVANFNLPQYHILRREERGIPVFENATAIKAHSYIPGITYQIYNQLYSRLFKKATVEFGVPDLIYAHFSYPTGFVAQALSRTYHVPYSVMEHSSMFFEKVPFFVQHRMGSLIEDSKSFMCVSQSLKNAICKVAPSSAEKIQVVYNAIDSDFDYSEPRSCNVFQFFTAGNLVPIKQFHVLISAVAELVNDGFNIKLRIAGEGPERVKLQEQIKSLRLHNNIELIGRLSKVEMKKEYINCSAFVLPSRAETFGVVCREAMFVGRPVISFDNGGIREGWRPEFGIIVKEQTSHELCRAMSEMINNYSIYNHEMISKISHELFSPKSIGERLSELL